MGIFNSTMLNKLIEYDL